MPMQMINCWYPYQQLEFLENLVREGHFANRSEALRYALTELTIEFSELFPNNHLETEDKEGGRQFTD